MVSLVATHANAGQQHNFATCQLLQIAASCLVRPRDQLVYQSYKTVTPVLCLPKHVLQ